MSTPAGLCMQGRVDFSNADELCALGSRLLRGRTEQISVDLEQIDDAGSAIIAILLVWAQTSPHALNLIALPSSMRRVLEFTGMDELFVYPGPAEQLADNATLSVAARAVDAVPQESNV